MRRLAGLALVTLVLLVVAPTGASADDRSGTMSRPHPFIPCCLGAVYLPPAPPVIVVPPPTIYVVVPSPPSLVYVPTPRPEPAPEITLPTGRWARHGNGVDYPYVWVWAGPAATR